MSATHSPCGQPARFEWRPEGARDQAYQAVCRACLEKLRAHKWISKIVPDVRHLPIGSEHPCEWTGDVDLAAHSGGDNDASEV